MDIDYREIGRRIALRRRKLGLRQAEVEEKANIGYKYLSSIERGCSIPSTEVIMKIAAVLDTTPDEFLVGTLPQENGRWKDVSALLKNLDEAKLETARLFLTWLNEQP